MAQKQSMKTMRLYDQVERILNELHHLGIDEDSPLSVEDLTPFDQYHYHGTAAVDEAARLLGATGETQILEIGSGIGGPARHMAHATGCKVTAVELQPDLSALSEQLTARCGLAGQIDHVCANVLDRPLEGCTFDAIMSFLVFLHIPARAELFDVCRSSLNPGGSMIIEDYIKLKEPNARQAEDLKVKVQCPYVPDMETYRQDLEKAGFTSVEMEDMSSSWTAFTAERLAAYEARRDHNVKVNGEDLTNGLQDFYATTAGLFGSGVIGGVRILARRD
ncbi:MAG: methyltransferase domain-containing protein [Pseudomonadota bacterium]